MLRDAEVNKTDKSLLINSINSLFSGQIRVQSKALVLNTVLSTMQQSRFDLITDNGLAIEKAEWANSLDSNVCGFCEDLDGNIYLLEEAPECPVHANCNCELIPV